MQARNDSGRFRRGAPLRGSSGDATLKHPWETHHLLRRPEWMRPFRGATSSVSRQNFCANPSDCLMSSTRSVLSAALSCLGRFGEDVALFAQAGVASQRQETYVRSVSSTCNSC